METEAVRAEAVVVEAGAEEAQEVENGRLVQLTWNLRSHLTQVSQQLEVMQAQRTKLVSYTRFLEQQLADEKARAAALAPHSAAGDREQRQDAQKEEARDVEDQGLEEAQGAPEAQGGGGAAGEAAARRLALALALLFLAWARQRKATKALAHGVRQARSEAGALQEANDELRRLAEEHEECMRRQAAAIEAAASPELREETGQRHAGREPQTPLAAAPAKPFPDSEEEARFQDFAASMGFAASPAATNGSLVDSLEESDEEELESGRSESAGELGMHRKRPRTTSAPAPHAPMQEEEEAEEAEDSRPPITDAEVLDDLVQLRKKLESFQTLLKFADSSAPAAAPPRAPLSQSGPGWGAASTNNSDGALPINRQLALGRGLPRPEWEKHRRRCSRLFRALVDPVESGLVSPATAAGASRSSR